MGQQMQVIPQLFLRQGKCPLLQDCLKVLRQRLWKSFNRKRHLGKVSFMKREDDTDPLYFFLIDTTMW